MAYIAESLKAERLQGWIEAITQFKIQYDYPVN